MFVVFLLNILGATMAVQHYRFTTYPHGVKEIKDVTYSEDDQYAIFQVSSGSKGRIKTEFHDFKTGYAAYKSKGDKCLITKTPFVMDDVKNSIVAQIKKTPSLSISGMEIEEQTKEQDKHKLEPLVGMHIIKFCGELNVFKATPKRTRSRKPGDRPKKRCWLFCSRTTVNVHHG